MSFEFSAENDWDIAASPCETLPGKKPSTFTFRDSPNKNPDFDIRKIEKASIYWVLWVEPSSLTWAEHGPYTSFKYIFYYNQVIIIWHGIFKINSRIIKTHAIICTNIIYIHDFLHVQQITNLCGLLGWPQFISEIFFVLVSMSTIHLTKYTWLGWTFI